MHLEDTVGETELETADFFNKFFTSVFNAVKIFETIPTFGNQTVNRAQFDDNSILSCLQNLKSTKSTGPDGLGNYVLANAAPKSFEICEANLFNDT